MSTRSRSGRNVDGPTQVFAQINQDPTFSTYRTLLGQRGSTVVFGDFLVIPINDSFLYVQPVYVRSNQASSIPELKRVIVVNGNTVGVGTSLTEALADSTTGQTGGGGGGGGDGGGGGPPGSTVDQQISGLLNRGAAAFPGRRRGADEPATWARTSPSSHRRRRSSSRRTTFAAQQTGTGGVVRFADPSSPSASPSGRSDRSAFEPEPEIGLDVGDVHLRLLQAARVVPVHRLPARELVEHPDAGLP